MKTTRTAVCALLLGIAGGVGVASGEPSGTGSDKPVVEQLLEIMRASGQITQEQHDALLEQAREEQAAAAEAQARASTAASRAEASAGSGVLVRTGRDGLRVQSADGAFKFRVGGRIQGDFAVFDEDISPLGDGAEIRRARLKAEGTMWDDWAYKLETNFETNGNADLTDAWLRYQGFGPTRLTFGHQKVPFSQQSMTSSNWQVFQERALLDAFIDNEETGRRRLGITGGAHGDHWHAQVGFFGEGIDDAGTADESWGTAGRFVFAPLAEETRVLAFGGSVYYRDFRGGDELDFAARPEAHIAGTKMIDTGDILGVDDLLLYNAEVTGVWGPFHAQAEYTGSEIYRGGATDLHYQGWYVQAGYFLTGESRNYDMKSAQYKRIVPRSSVGDRGSDGPGLGAWEIALRYSWLDLDDRDVDGGRERNVTFGLNWWATPSFLFRLNYVYANPDSSFDDEDEHVHVFQGRAQVVF